MDPPTDHRGPNRATVRIRPTALTDKFPITASLAIGMEFFIKGIPLLSPRIYKLGEIRLPPLLFYSDAEWTVLNKPPWLSKGLGGIMWQPGLKPFAAAVDTPQHLVDALSPRKTHIISLEFMAAAERLYTYDICGLRSSLPLCASKAVPTETDYGLGE